MNRAGHFEALICQEKNLNHGTRAFELFRRFLVPSIQALSTSSFWHRGKLIYLLSEAGSRDAAVDVKLPSVLASNRDARRFVSQLHAVANLVDFLPSWSTSLTMMKNREGSTNRVNKREK